MRGKLRSCLALLLPIVLWAFGASYSSAQQNLFNVPSARITPHDTVFVQQQFNLRSDGISNTTIDFGLWNETEIGLNLLDVPAYNDPASALRISDSAPDILFNIQKGLWITEDIHFGIGGQFGGATTDPDEPIDFSTFDWIVIEKEVGELGFIYAGAYYGNHTYLGPGNEFGAMLGYELTVVKDRFVLMGDVLTGTNDISVAVLGLAYTIPDSHWQLSLGYQLPFPGSRNGDGVVLEITWLPIKPVHDPQNDPEA